MQHLKWYTTFSDDRLLLSAIGLSEGAPRLATPRTLHTLKPYMTYTLKPYIRYTLKPYIPDTL